MDVYNTISKKKEKFEPLKTGLVTMYCCGPTVYDFVHIGNFRTFIFYDIARRVLEYNGYKVKQVVNITDVDDKTIKGSRETNSTLKSYTETYTKYFLEDIKKLNIKPAELYPHATDNILEMAKIIKKLVKDGYAYAQEDGIYYSIKKFKDYGKLSGAVIDSEAIKIKKDEYSKENAADFALWKAWSPEDGDVFWEHGLIRGRPGWHIECSAMSMKYLGETIDIHSGAVDLIFPHHENEIAQSEAYTGKKFVRYWLHPEHLLVNGQKMSKSMNNFYTLRDLEGMGFDPLAFRMLVLDADYRSKLDFDLNKLKKYSETLKRATISFCAIPLLKENEENADTSEISRLLDGFSESIGNDFDTHSALVSFFGLVELANQRIREKSISVGYRDALEAAFERMDSVLGLLKRRDVPENIKSLIEKRETARKNNQWSEADALRIEIKNKGFEVVDLEGVGPVLI